MNKQERQQVQDHFQRNAPALREYPPVLWLPEEYEIPPHGHTVNVHDERGRLKDHEPRFMRCFPGQDGYPARWLPYSFYHGDDEYQPGFYIISLDYAGRAYWEDISQQQYDYLYPDKCLRLFNNKRYSTEPILELLPDDFSYAVGFHVEKMVYGEVINGIAATALLANVYLLSKRDGERLESLFDVRYEKVSLQGGE